MTRIGVDIGGTFTDVVLVEDDSDIRTIKIPSTPDKPDEAVVDGLERAKDQGRSITDADFLAHGTTVTTNAVLENELAKTALLTTAGFKDVLEIGRQDRADLYDLEFERPPPIVPRDLRYTVDERVDSEGSVLTPLDPEDVDQVIERLPEDVEAIAVSTLFSFLNDEHERRIFDRLTDAFSPEEISLSSEVLPELREYERTSTTVMNAALKPVIEQYLDRLATNTADVGIDEEWVVMQSNGGLMSKETAQERPVTTLLSGPAAGVKGAQYLAEAAGFDDIITMDMGGTSTDISLINEGTPTYTTDWQIGHHPVRVPAIDIHTIGAGGGSIAWIDAGGALRVGPKSAGADPGPAAYGRGGERPTVTDAHVVLNRIHPEFPLGGELAVDQAAAEAAIEAHIAPELGQSPTEAAMGILEVARANMERALRVVSVERGYDPRSFALVAFGGAGPLHAAGLAEELSIPKVIVPRMAGVLSGLGLLETNLRHSYVRTHVSPIDDTDAADVEEAFEEMVEDGTETLLAEGLSAEQLSFDHSVDLRYVGQSFSLNVDIDRETFQERGFEPAVERFHELHEVQYGHANPEEPVELVNVRVTAEGAIESVDIQHEVNSTLEDAHLGTRSVRYGSGEYETAIYDHQLLPSGAEFPGPAIVQAREATTVVHPGQSVAVDDRGSLVVTTKGGR